MPSGLQTYSPSGVLQFDSEGSHYVLAQVFKGPETYSKNYSASDHHLIVSYTKRSTGRTDGIITVTKQSNGTFTCESHKVGGATPTNDDFLLIFEPMHLVVNAASPGNGFGLETYDATGKIVYSSNYPTVNIRGVFLVPPSEPQNNAFYGTGPGSYGAYDYILDTGIPGTNRLHYAVLFSQVRMGNEYDASGDYELDLLSESYELYIDGGTVNLALSAREFAVTTTPLPGWQTGSFTNYGSQYIYILDLSRMQHLLV